MNENGGARSGDFGSCCGELNEALSSEEFDPFIVIGEDEVLYMSVGSVETEEGDTGIVEHPIFFCPFCGTRLQTPEQVNAKIGDAGDSQPN